MSFRLSRQIQALLALCVPLLIAACDSPLSVNTPRKEYVEGIGVPMHTGIGEGVSVLLPIDTSDTTARRPAFSSALVFDCSGSIIPLVNTAMKAGGHAFLDSLDGEHDESAVIFFNSLVTVYQRISTDVALLRAAVQALPYTGATAMWDGIYTGLLELQSRGAHERKALVVVTETEDNSSTVGTPEKIISLAKNTRVRIYTISLKIGKDENMLATLSRESGGRHFRFAPLSTLPEIYREIAHTLRMP